MLTLAEVEKEITQRADIIGALASELPSYGVSFDGGRPHIEVTSEAYHFIVLDRGQKVKHVSSPDLDEILYLVFDSATFQMASTFELNHRVIGKDPRRILWKRQLGLLRQLSMQWHDRCQSEISKILEKHPYNDR
jgi:hypothetical protein